MKNKIHKYDFLILGAGLIGSLAALELYKKKFKVLICEKNNKTIADKRTLAVNANSKDFLSSLGLWRGLQKQAIDKIIIKDTINQSPLSFEDNGEAMGYVVFNRDLLSAARAEIKKNKIQILDNNLDINSLKTNDPIRIGKNNYSFNKVIIAIGKNYSENIKIKKNTFSSNHTSYVGFFDHQNSHNNKAYEIFTKYGPVAVLPAPSSNKLYSTFIYSCKNKTDNKSLTKLLRKYFKNSHGNLSIKEKIYSFKILPHMSQSHDKNFILIGDSLRSIHPVAGQGWNLGVKDIQTLSMMLDTYPFDMKHFTNIYYAKRNIEGSAYLSFTSLINFLYENNYTFTKLTIKMGYQFLQFIHPLRRLFIKQAMGRLKLV